MFGQSEAKDSKSYHAIVTAHIFIDEKGEKDIEILDFTEDDEGTEIFCDKDYMLLDYINIGEKDQYFFTAHIRAWFHSYYDYFDGYQAEVESEIIELKSLSDFAQLNLS